jgi:N-acetylmuramoyl-L-alanine amidase/Putative peptidoglycan binding domain
VSLLKPAPSTWRVLHRGLIGHDVAALQAVLRLDPKPDAWPARWPLAVDGNFGAQTEQATEAFQGRRGLQMTGVVGPETTALIDPTLFIDPTPVPDKGLPSIAFVQARYWGWADRTAIDLIVLHSAEVGEGHSSAEAVAAYFKVGGPKPSSAHYVADDDSLIQCVRDEHIAFHAPGANTRGLGIEQAGYAKQTRDEWLDPYGQRMLSLVARLVAAKAEQYSIPLVWLTVSDLLSGQRGLTTHVDVTRAFHKSDHVDPGPAYPKDVLLDLAKAA